MISIKAMYRHELAKHVDIHPATLRKRLKKLGIESRTKLTPDDVSKFMSDWTGQEVN